MASPTAVPRSDPIAWEGSMEVGQPRRGGRWEQVGKRRGRAERRRTALGEYEFGGGKSRSGSTESCLSVGRKNG